MVMMVYIVLYFLGIFSLAIYHQMISIGYNLGLKMLL